MQVPTYNRQVMPNALPTVRQTYNNTSATAEDFGAAKARQVGQFGVALQGIGEQVLDNVNKARVRDALNNARQQSIDLMNEVQSRKGIDAATAKADTEKGMTEIRKSSTQSLSLPIQQKMFDSVFNDMALSNTETALKHQTREGEVYRIQTLDAENQTKTMAAMQALSSGDMDLWANKWSEAAFAIKQNTASKFAPYGAEVVKAEQQTAMNAFHLNVADTMTTSQSPAAALDYLKQNKAEIDPRAYADKAERFGALNLQEKVHAESLKIDAMDAPLEKKLELAKNLPADISGNVEANVMRWANQKIAIAERAEQDRTEAQVGQINKTLHGLDPLKATGADVEAAILQAEKDSGATMNPVTRERLLTSWNNALEAQQSPVKKARLEQTKFAAYEQLSLMAESQPEVFAQQNLYLAAPVLGDSMTKELMEKQADIRSGKPGKKTAEETAFISETSKWMEDMPSLASTGLEKKLSGPELEAEQTRRYEVRGRLREEIGKEIAALPKEKRTYENMAAIRNRLLKPVVQVDTWKAYRWIPGSGYVLPDAKSMTQLELADRWAEVEETAKSVKSGGIPLAPDFQRALRLPELPVDAAEQAAEYNSKRSEASKGMDALVDFASKVPFVGIPLVPVAAQGKKNAATGEISSLYEVQMKEGRAEIHAYGPMAQKVLDAKGVARREDKGTMDEVVLDTSGNILRGRLKGSDQYVPWRK